MENKEMIYLIPGYVCRDGSYCKYHNLTDEQLEMILNELSVDLILIENRDLSPYSDIWGEYNMYTFISNIVVKHARDRKVHSVSEFRTLKEMVNLGYKIAILDEYRKTNYEKLENIDAESIIIIDQYLKDNTGE